MRYLQFIPIALIFTFLFLGLAVLDSTHVFPTGFYISNFDDDTVFFRIATLGKANRYSDESGTFSLDTTAGTIECKRDFTGIESIEVIHDDPATDKQYAKLRVSFTTGRIAVGLMPLTTNWYTQPDWDIVTGETPEGYQRIDLCRVHRIERISWRYYGRLLF
jgi:hypothetical protein